MHVTQDSYYVRSTIIVNRSFHFAARFTSRQYLISISMNLMNLLTFNVFVPVIYIFPCSISPGHDQDKMNYRSLNCQLTVDMMAWCHTFFSCSYFWSMMKRWTICLPFCFILNKENIVIAQRMDHDVRNSKMCHKTIFNY